jgi:hypothetical protein
MGAVPRKLRDDARAWSVSPDGSLVAFTANPGNLASHYSTSWYYGFGHREIWLMGRNGEQARKVCETDENSAFWRAQWSPDGQRVAYLRFHQTPEKFEIAIESRDLKGGPPTTILSGEGFEDFRWLSDGRIIYSLDEPDPNAWMCNFWETRIKARTGKPDEKSWRLTNWAGFCESGFSATSDGKELAFRKSNRESSVYVADLEASFVFVLNTLVTGRVVPGRCEAEHQRAESAPHKACTSPRSGGLHLKRRAQTRIEQRIR